MAVDACASATGDRRGHLDVCVKRMGGVENGRLAVAPFLRRVSECVRLISVLQCVQARVCVRAPMQTTTCHACIRLRASKRTRALGLSASCQVLVHVFAPVRMHVVLSCECMCVFMLLNTCLGA
eukprot:6202419-Pleurochrysis_carterae.AAC.2